MDNEPSISFGPPLWPVNCAWCKAEGKSKIVDWSTVKNSHGVCGRHKREIERSIDRHTQKGKGANSES